MPGLIGPDEIRAVADAGMEVVGADAVEVLVIHEWGGLTRFANSSIHQSISSEDTGVRVRVVVGSRVGVAGSNDLSRDGAAAAAASAMEMARFATADPDFAGLAPKADVGEQPGRFDEETAQTSPRDRAEGVARLIGEVTDGFHAAGAVETTAAEVALANSEGQFCYAPYTKASASTVVSGGDGGTGTAELATGRFEELDPEDVGRRAFGKARDSQNPREVPAGRYEVVLEPMAVDTLVTFLAFMGFSGKGITEGRSPFSGKAGSRVCGENITIVDDALSPLTIGLPFDFEGTPKRRLPIIDHGVFVTGVHDRRSAKMAGTASTGHALPAPNPDGAFPLNLFLTTGDAEVKDMVAGTSRGLLVTRFHYSNIVHPIETTITGMTRDGTWWIEGGEVAYPVKNLRFTQSILDALSNVEAIGREAVLASEFFFAASRVPALKVSGFTFSGVSDH